MANYKDSRFFGIPGSWADAAVGALSWIRNDSKYICLIDN